MKRLVLATTLLLFAAGSLDAAWLKNLQAAKDEAKKKDQLIFVDLFASWCGWCYRMEADVFPAEAFQNATKDMVLLRLDTEDGKEGTKFAQEFQIRSLPTFLLITHQGTIAGIISGYAPAPQFVERMNQTVADWKKFKKKLDSEKKVKDPQARLELARELVQRRSYLDAERRYGALIVDKRTPQPVRDEAHYQLALSRMLRGELVESSKTIQNFRTSRKDGEFVERASLLLADIYMKQGRYKEALGEFNDFKKRFPQSQLSKNFEPLIPQLEAHLARAQ